MKKDKLEVVRGSGNIYRDFDKPDADVRQLKAILAAEIIKALDKQGLAYDIVDITEVSEARDYVMALGYLQAPVVVAGGEHWSGFRPDRIRAIAGGADASATSVSA